MFITGVNDTGDKLFTGVNDTGDEFVAGVVILVTDFQGSPVSLIPVTTTSVIRVCGVSMNTSFHGGSNETIGGRVRLRRPELLLFWFEVVLAASGASN
jgi:hypothetical protein